MGQKTPSIAGMVERASLSCAFLDTSALDPATYPFL